MVASSSGKLTTAVLVIKKDLHNVFASLYRLRYTLLFEDQIPRVDATAFPSRW